MLSAIIEFLKSAWNFIKKVFRIIISFFKDIIEWFKERLYRHEDKVPFIYKMNDKIKEELDSGNYTVVQGFLDLETGEIDREDIRIINANELDSNTRKVFQENDLAILK